MLLLALAGALEVVKGSGALISGEQGQWQCSVAGWAHSEAVLLGLFMGK